MLAGILRQNTSEILLKKSGENKDFEKSDASTGPLKSSCF
jgi:hypothetical protein